MICKIFHRIVFFLAALACLQLTSCGGGGGGDGDDGYDVTPGTPLSAAEFASFRASHSNYFEDTGFANLIATVISGGSPSSNNHTYYISPNGNDDNSGSSQSSPLKTFDEALDRMVAGDTLIVMDGTYAMGNGDAGIEVENNGTASAYITIKAQNKGKAIITGGTATKRNNYALMYISGKYIIVDGLKFDGLRSNGGSGVSFENGANHIAIANCTFTDIKTPRTASKTIKDTSNAIIGYGTKGAKPISSILIYKNTCTNMATGWSECISLTENCQYVSIIDNYIDGTENIGIDVGGNYGNCDDLSKGFTRYAYIAHNTVANETTERTYKDTCYGIYADGGQHIQILNNKVENCMGGIECGAEEELGNTYPADDITVSGNEIINAKKVFFACGGWEEDRGLVKNVHFTGNTCTANRDAGSMVNLAKCDNVEIKRNTFKSGGNFGITKVYREYSGWNLNPAPNVNDVENENTWIGF